MIDNVEYLDFNDDLEHENKWDPLIIGFEGDVVCPSEKSINQMQSPKFKCPMLQIYCPF